MSGMSLTTSDFVLLAVIKAGDDHCSMGTTPQIGLQNHERFLTAGIHLVFQHHNNHAGD